jgi:hypothetical protein
MAIGPFKATVVDVFNQRLDVGGINIVKDLGISPNLHLHGESRIKALFVVNNLHETGSPGESGNLR